MILPKLKVCNAAVKSLTDSQYSVTSKQYNSDARRCSLARFRCCSKQFRARFDINFCGFPNDVGGYRKAARAALRERSKSLQWASRRHSGRSLGEGLRVC